MWDQSNTQRPIDKTTLNIAAARARSAWVGRYRVEYKWMTGKCFFLPQVSSGEEAFFNEGVKRWRRLYWLTCGVFISWEP